MAYELSPATKDVQRPDNYFLPEQLKKLESETVKVDGADGIRGVKAIFKHYDANGDGKLSLEEILRSKAQVLCVWAVLRFPMAYSLNSF